MLQLIPVLAIALLAAFGATGYIVVQQNQQIQSLTDHVKELQVRLIPTVTPTPSPTPEPTATPTPTLRPIPAVTAKPKAWYDYPPGEAPASEPNTKQKALIEIENKMSGLKEQIQKYLANYERSKNTPYAGMILDAAKELSKEYQDLEKSRWQIMGQQ